MATLYIGTYTRREEHADGHGQGIYCFELDENTFSVTPRSRQGGITNPSFLALTTSGTRLYAASEITSGPGRLYAYAIDEQSGRLTLLNYQSTLGAAPCYVTIHEQHVFVANYLGGSVAVLPLNADGSVCPPSDHIIHRGSSVNASRQQAPHPHAIVLDTSREHALVPDLGTDCVASLPV